MKLFDKLKNALFEEDEDEIEEVSERKTPESLKEEKIVKKVDVEKTFEDTKPEIKIEPVLEKKTPIIFDDEDFLSDTREVAFAKTPTKEDKVLYGGYEQKEVITSVKPKEKFKPSPVISPVYGVLNKNYNATESDDDNKKSLDELFSDDKSKSISFDEIREKAYGGSGSSYIEEDDDEKEETSKTLLYDMQKKDDTPGIEKITLGDAEEYYNDLGLEYEVDYKDAAKTKTTRTSKNKDLSDELDLAATREINVKKEVVKVKPKTAKDIKKEKAFAFDDDEDDEPEEKNLYDLIDMMYDNKK